MPTNPEARRVSRRMAHVHGAAPRSGSHARATLAVGRRAATATFEFGPDGLMTGMSGERERDVGRGRSVLTPFRGVSSDFRPVDGLLVPFRMEAIWIVDGKPFPYARFEVEQLDFEPGAGRRR